MDCPIGNEIFLSVACSLYMSSDALLTPIRRRGGSRRYLYLLLFASAGTTLICGSCTMMSLLDMRVLACPNPTCAACKGGPHARDHGWQRRHFLIRRKQAFLSKRHANWLTYESKRIVFTSAESSSPLISAADGASS